MAAGVQIYDEIIEYGAARLYDLSPELSAERDTQLKAFRFVKEKDMKYPYDQIKHMERILSDPVHSLHERTVQIIGVCCIIAAGLIVVGFVATFLGYARTWGLLVPVGLTALWLLGETANGLAKVR